MVRISYPVIIILIIGILLWIAGWRINPDENRFSWPIGKDNEWAGSNEEHYVHPGRARGFFIGGLIIRFGIMLDSILIILITRSGRYTKTLSSNSGTPLFSQRANAPVPILKTPWWLVLIIFMSGISTVKSCIVNFTLDYIDKGLQIDFPWFLCAPFLYAFLSLVQLCIFDLVLKFIFYKTIFDVPQGRKLVPLLKLVFGDLKIVPLLILALGDLWWNFFGGMVEAFHLYFGI